MFYSCPSVDGLKWFYCIIDFSSVLKVNISLYNVCSEIWERGSEKEDGGLGNRQRGSENQNSSESNKIIILNIKTVENVERSLIQETRDVVFNV